MSDAQPRVWVLNLDAELELADPGYTTPSASMRERMVRLRGQLHGLLRPEDLVLDERVSIPALRHARGLAWCPTPRALKLLSRCLGAPPPAPALDVLRKVNHRRFCASLGQPLPGACFVESTAELERILAAPSAARGWLLKRPLGFAGRGQLRVDPGPLSEGTRRWTEPGLRKGEGLQVEPLLELEDNFAIHGMLKQDGALLLGDPTLQRCSAQGVWERSELAGAALLATERERLEAEAIRVAKELHRASYFGPFNLDAFAWRDGSLRRFNPRSEINARFSMGWSVGMQGRPW